MANLLKSAIHTKYDQLRTDLKKGEISQEQFKRSADRLYKLYHSKANKAQRAKDAKPVSKQQQQTTKTPTKQQRTPTANTTTKPSNTRQKRQPGSTGGRGKAPSGTHGQSLPSNPKLKSQSKPKTRRARGSGVKRTGKKLKMFNLTAMLRELGGVDRKTGRRKKN